MKEKLEKRPQYETVRVTTPHSNTMLALLGAGEVYEGLAFTKDEWEALKRLYFFERERPNKKPSEPTPPKKEDFDSVWEFDRAVRGHEDALKRHENWKDPLPFHQAGADRNAIRYAIADGLRMLAWIAKHVEPGRDPLKALVQLASDAGWDVSGDDVEWADSDDSAV